MKFILATIVLLVAAVSFSVCCDDRKEGSQYLSLYDSRTLPRRIFHLNSTFSDLTEENLRALFPYGIGTICFTGHLRFTTGDSRTGRGDVISGVNKCIDWNEVNFDGVSPKYVSLEGSTDNYDRAFVCPYNEKNYMDPAGCRSSQYTQITPKSVYITGTNTAITLYTQTEFTGLSICLKNDSGEIGVGIRDFVAFVGGTYTFRSLRHGCHSTNVYNVK